MKFGHTLLSAILLLAACVVASCDVETSIHILVVALSLTPLPVDGHPIPLTTINLVDSVGRFPLTVSPSESVEVVTLNVVVAAPSLSRRSNPTSSEQTNTSNTDSQPTQCMGDDNHRLTANGSISRRTIITVVGCVFLFFTMLVAIYLWQKYYPPRPGRRQNANQLGVGFIQTGSTTPTEPVAVATR